MRTHRASILGLAAISLLLSAWSTVAAPHTVQIVRCVDGEAQSIQISGPVDGALKGLTCDGDGAVNGSCTFVARCPLCTLGDPPCNVGCTPDATFTWSATPASRIARESVDGHLLIFRCIAHHARDSHRR